MAGSNVSAARLVIPGRHPPSAAASATGATNIPDAENPTHEITLAANSNQSQTAPVSSNVHANAYSRGIAILARIALPTNDETRAKFPNPWVDPGREMSTSASAVAEIQCRGTRVRIKLAQAKGSIAAIAVGTIAWAHKIGCPPNSRARNAMSNSYDSRAYEGSISGRFRPP